MEFEFDFDDLDELEDNSWNEDIPVWRDINPDEYVPFDYDDYYTANVLWTKCLPKAKRYLYTQSPDDEHVATIELLRVSMVTSTGCGKSVRLNQ